MSKKFSTYLLLLFLAVLIFPNTIEAAVKKVDRISGQSRYETAVAVSKKGWATAPAVVISVGTNFPDALSGSPLAYSLNAPILLTGKSELPAVTKQEIVRLQAKKAVILGGSSAITDNVVKTLQSMGLATERISGVNRYDTSVKIAQKLNTTSKTAIVVYGENYPDSLSIAAYAARNKMPIILTGKDSIPAATKELLKKFSSTIVVGGNSAVSDTVFRQLPSPKRIAGANRYATSANIVKTLNIPANPAYVASGASFADALTGSVLAAKNNSSILLVQPNAVPQEIMTLADQRGIQAFNLVGGTGVLSANVANILSFDVNSLIATAKAYIGVPYVFDGTTASGFDCSGYLNFVYDKNGVDLPRTTSDIWNASKVVSQPSPGDIVFYQTYKPGPSHAGIYLGNNQFIHAGSSRGVEISDMNISYWKSRYLGAKRPY
ncbi:cell wall-binding repeat-containing protein [Bacillus sp. ISL-37]|uniref:cell wall-binding repeat-containing protein n=1 Tax=Bacillus sp. ISL-37 TaxID=2819123 RepID=UPI001BEB8D53|nr:cell wall-binding repeat-containing protein [Bacillus sp. ISL-37]MBT2685997.1 cell wall-binding repeat-containing protein [Bacillus sp. ISL-37]